MNCSLQAQKFGDFVSLRQSFYILCPQDSQRHHQYAVHHHTGQNADQRCQRVGAVSGVAAEKAIHQTVHCPRGAAHQDRGQHRLCEQLDVPGLLRGILPHEEQIQAADGQIAAQRRNGRAVNVDVRIAHQNVIHDHFHHAAGDDGENGKLLLAVGLQNGVGENHETNEDQCDA